MSNYSEKQIDDAWEKARPIEGIDPKVWRKDPCGALIKRDQYGKENAFGWDIDHIIPLSLFEGDDTIPENRWAMHWLNNYSKGNSFPEYSSNIISKVHSFSDMSYESENKDNLNITTDGICFIPKDTLSNLLTIIKPEHRPIIKNIININKEQWVSVYGIEQIEKWLKLL